MASIRQTRGCLSQQLQRPVVAADISPTCRAVVGAKRRGCLRQQSAGRFTAVSKLEQTLLTAWPKEWTIGGDIRDVVFTPESQVPTKIQSGLAEGKSWTIGGDIRDMVLTPVTDQLGVKIEQSCSKTSWPEKWRIGRDIRDVVLASEARVASAKVASGLADQLDVVEAKANTCVPSDNYVRALRSWGSFMDLYDPL